MTETDHQPIDPLLSSMMLATPSPGVGVLRSMTDKREEFKVTHEPMSCPPLPPPPPKVIAGKRAHVITTLTDLRTYVAHASGAPSAESGRGAIAPIAFYGDAGVFVVLDETEQHEREVITCNLERHAEFQRWSALIGKDTPHRVMIQFLRENTIALERANPGASRALIDSVSSLAGELVHGAEEFLDSQAGSASFMVKRKVRGQLKECESAAVPTDFTISLPVLADDETFMLFKVLVRYSGAQGAQIQMTLCVEDFAERVRDHIDKRLKAFASSAGFLCVRGTYRETPWAEPKLPESIAALMKLQTEMLAEINRKAQQ